MILNSANATYLDSMYEAYLNDPDSVDPKWRDYFRSLAHDNADSTPALNASTLGQSRSQFAQKQTSVLNYISAVRYRGHRVTLHQEQFCRASKEEQNKQRHSWFNDPTGPQKP